MKQFFRINIRINSRTFVIFLLFGLFFVIVPKTYGQLIESRPWLTIVGTPTGPPPGGGANFIFYRQDDPRWEAASSCHYSWAICGPTTIAMIMSTFGVIMTPDQTDNLATQQRPPIRACYDSPWTGTNGWDRFFLLPEFASNGFRATSLSISTSVANMRVWKDTYIGRGFLILGSATSANGAVSHIFVIDDVNPDAVDSRGNPDPQIHLRDPARNNPDGYWNSANTPWISNGGTTCYFVYAYAITRS